MAFFEKLSHSTCVSALLVVYLISSLTGCQTNHSNDNYSAKTMNSSFHIVQSDEEIKVLMDGDTSVIVVQSTRPDYRPYLHPIKAPGSEVNLTQFSPDHHKHQTGLFWGLTRVNGTGATPDEIREWFYRPDKPQDIQTKIGRDFFHNPAEGYWQKVSADVISPTGREVAWQTVYHMLDGAGNPLMEETQTWTFTENAGRYFLSLEWTGTALRDMVINEFEYGGLFLRMP